MDPFYHPSVSSAEHPSSGGVPFRPVIGVLTWNGYDLARACLESLQVLAEWPIPTVVVDNGSVLPEGERLALEFGPPVESLRLDPNAGVPGGYNAAMQWALRRGASHVLLLNNDVTVTDPRMLGHLARATAADVAAVGPVIFDGQGTLYSAGGAVSMWKGKSRHLAAPEDPAAGPYDVTWLDGPCMLVSIDAVKAIGGLAPEFVSYWEELDWCVRARTAGYRCLVEPRTSVVHLRGGTIPSWQARQMMLRNGILFVRRHGSLAHNVTSLAYFFLRSTPLLIARSLAQRPRGFRRAASSWTAAIGWNIRDAWRRKHWRVPADGPSLD